MGYITPLIILNDAVHLLDDKRFQKKFCEDLYRAACNTSEQDITISIAGCCNPVTVLRAKHADDSRSIYVGENSIIDVWDAIRFSNGKFTNTNYMKKIALQLIDDGKKLLNIIKEQNKKEQVNGR